MKRRSRLIFGCQRCRARHLRCDNKSLVCFQCRDDKATCVRESNIRFRGVNKDVNLDFPKNQTWFRFEAPIEFEDETMEIMKSYQDDLPRVVVNSEQAKNSSEVRMQGHFRGNGGSKPEEIHDQMASKSCSLPGLYELHVGGSNNEQLDFPALEQAWSQDITEPFAPGGLIFPSLGPSFHEAAFLDLPYLTTPPSEGPTSPGDLSHNKGHSLTEASLTSRQAVLMRNFIENMAKWADITDLHRHFELEVPRRAIQHPILKLAIFAFSARHLSRQNDSDESESLQYHDECLQLLIPQVSTSMKFLDEDLLSAIAILRGYEEMDASDDRCHLIGTTKIINTISTFGSSGGLGEAAAWLCLRQDIYVSLISQQPLKTQLANYHGSNVFEGASDIFWANRMIFLLAKVLSFAFIADHNTTAKLSQVGREIDRWYEEKPGSFVPIMHAPRNVAQGRAFPEVWLISCYHVVALQYYHIAKLVLAVSTRQTLTTGYENLRHGRRVEKTVRSHLQMIIGLAASNSSAESTLFTAHHCLSVWGGVLKDSLEREAAVSFLQDMRRRTGWTTEGLAQSLKEQWDEDLEIQ